MKEVILKAMEACALRYAKGFPRWRNQWDERLTISQKAVEIAQELEEEGWALIKRESVTIIEPTLFLENLDGE